MPRRGSGTPEGVYYACVRNEQSKYHLSIGLSYPNVIDAERGLKRECHRRSEDEAIASAIGTQKRPPWDTPLGGEIMIHGGGTESDWTAGCIGLEEENMAFLWENIEIGTVVEILP